MKVDWMQGIKAVPPMIPDRATALSDQVERASVGGKVR